MGSEIKDRVMGQKSEVRSRTQEARNKIQEKILPLSSRLLPLAFRVMPLWIEAIGMGAVMGAIVDSNKRFKERLKEIDGKLFLFEASDLGKKFFLYIKDGDIKIIPHLAKEPDVVMRGETKILFGLLLGKEDPDTVFFSRKLEISGDTAAAIHFKNILNSL
ncbi:MAG: SCP2 sterol-binding domain-containing protein [Deltaproteobacteria bacterium]|nr:SCP2 sterol-binding domain-containing protein [Deltaproteobacteria bacterium]